MSGIAADRREAASNRQDALTAAGNLVLEQDDDVKAEVHARSRMFVGGGQDGSSLDAETTNPHPLSSMRIDLGSASLRAVGLRLAQCSATTQEDKSWVRDRGAVMLGSDDEQLVRMAALTLPRLGADVIGDLDASLLAGHPLPVVRQLSAVVAVAAPLKYRLTLEALAADPDSGQDPARPSATRRARPASGDDGRCRRVQSGRRGPPARCSYCCQRSPGVTRHGRTTHSPTGSSRPP